MFNAHDRNRQKVEPWESSEINLFVVDPESQGQGRGKKLINEFIAACKQTGVKRIVLETDEESNYGFYEHQGFRKDGSFFSSFLQEFSNESGETYIYELDL
jgi:GNAT superfamily N-acetyltransferase